MQLYVRMALKYFTCSFVSRIQLFLPESFLFQGSLALCHQKCLEMWLDSRGHLNRCEICLANYSVEDTLAVLVSQWYIHGAKWLALGQCWDHKIGHIWWYIRVPSLDKGSRKGNGYYGILWIFIFNRFPDIVNINAILWILWRTFSRKSPINWCFCAVCALGQHKVFDDARVVRHCRWIFHVSIRRCVLK